MTPPPPPPPPPSRPAPAKRAAAHSARLRAIVPEACEALPYAAHFPAGALAGVCRADGDVDDGGGGGGLRVVAYEKSRRHVLVAKVAEPSGGDGGGGAGDGVDYVGSNFRGDAAQWQPCQLALAAFDAQRRTLDLLPLAGDKVMRMEPRVRGVDYGDRALDDVGPQDEAEARGRGQRGGHPLPQAPHAHQLLWLQQEQAPGLCRASSVQAEALERAKVPGEAIAAPQAVGGFLQEAVQAEGLLTRVQAEEALNAKLVRNIPPHDLQATSPEDAYPLHQLIPHHIWDGLKVVGLVAAAHKPEKAERFRRLGTYPPYLLDRVHRLKGEDAGTLDRQARLLMYLSHLIRFYNAPTYLKLESSDSLSGASLDALSAMVHVPSSVLDFLIAQFTERADQHGAQAALRRPKEKSHLLLCHILVVALKADLFVVDPADIAPEVKMIPKELIPFFKEVGCTVEKVRRAALSGNGNIQSEKGLYRAVMAVPLQFPKLTSKRRRK
eukprot:SM000058S18504  [mRNA]  locus=s58:194614:197149:- [translate_table: standard]